MKMNENFVLCKVGKRTVAVPTGSASRRMKGMIKMNSSAALVWESLLAGESEEQTVSRMLEKYDLTEEHAHASYCAVVERMAEIGVLSLDD
ncbi:MAG: PqqD family protein [Lachnospiraceae bacterium]|nr:PqqD family protein [Lachnospiraceae bacterium]